jgi:predicted SnoaL-like aldol condensation-catalyzing enzyme
MSDPQANKQLVLDFFDLAYVQKKPQEAYERYLAAGFVQHDPWTPDGAEPFTVTAAGDPIEATVEVVRTVAEDDMVVVHAHLRDADPAALGLEGDVDRERGMAIMNVYRVADGRIAEHWDVFQPVPETPANDNTMF